MKTDIWMPVYIGDYLKDTSHFTVLEHGAYFLILIALWGKKGLLERSLRSATGATDSEWSQIKEIILPLLSQNDDGTYYSKRLRKEYEKAVNLHETKSKAGKIGGGNPNFKKGTSNPYYSQKDKQKDNQEDKQGYKQKINPSPSPSPSQTHAPTINKRERFKTPSLSDIQERVKSENLEYVNSEIFFNHYEGNGWMVGKNKMKNWKATLSGWNTRNKEKISNQLKTFTEREEDNLKSYMNEVQEAHNASMGQRGKDKRIQG